MKRDEVGAADYQAVRDEALKAFDEGYWPIPIKAGGSKSPALPAGYKATPLTEEIIGEWFTGRPAGVGVLCGESSGGLELFEFEGRAIEEGLLEAFEAKLYTTMPKERWEEIKRGWTDRSPSGGIHFHYRCEATKTVRLASKGVNEDEPGRPLIETKGEGGYVVIAPSTTLAARNPRKEATWGRPGWERVEGGPATVVRITVEERGALFDAARQFDRNTKRDSGAQGSDTTTSVTPPHSLSTNTSTSGVDAFLSARPQGSDWIDATIRQYNEREDWRSIIGGTFEYLETDSRGITYLHFPGAQNETSATLGAPNKPKIPDALCLHSTTALARTPFEEGHVYDKFAAACLLKYGSNDQQTRVRFARELREEGYGPPPEPVYATSTTAARGTSPCPELSDAFYNARPWLQHLRTAARARQAPPDAVLGAFLTEICLRTHWRYLLPPVVGRYAPPNIIICLVGRSGAGKGAAIDIACELIDTTTDQDDHRTNEGPAGTGEGMVRLFFAPKPKQLDGENVPTYKAVRVRIDEGSILQKHKDRNGSTTLTMLLSGYSGEALGNSVVGKENSFRLPATSYRLAVVIGIQPETAGPVINDTATGAAQRVLWVATTDTNAPGPDHLPPWPGPLGWMPPQWDAHPEALETVSGASRALIEIAAEVQREIRTERAKVVRGEEDGGHLTLNRLKVAALIGIIEGRPVITVNDWALAGQITRNSEDVCRWVHNQLRAVEERNDRYRATRVAAAEHFTATQDATMKRLEAWAVMQIGATTGGITEAQLRKAANSRDREYVSKALERAEATGQVERDDDGTWHVAPDISP